MKTTFVVVLFLWAAASGLGAQPTRQNIFHTAAHPSHVLVSLLPAGR